MSLMPPGPWVRLPLRVAALRRKATIRVLCALVFGWGGLDEIYPSHAAIAAKAGVKIATVRVALADLYDLGLIEWDDPSEMRATCTYRLLLADDEPFAPVTPLMHDDLTTMEIATWVGYWAGHADRKTGAAHPSKAEVAEAINASKASVIAAMKVLVAKGYAVEHTRRSSTPGRKGQLGHRTTRYVLVAAPGHETSAGGQVGSAGGHLSGAGGQSSSEKGRIRSSESVGQSHYNPSAEPGLGQSVSEDCLTSFLASPAESARSESLQSDSGAEERNPSPRGAAAPPLPVGRGLTGPQVRLWADRIYRVLCASLDMEARDVVPRHVGKMIRRRFDEGYDPTDVLLAVRAAAIDPPDADPFGRVLLPSEGEGDWGIDYYIDLAKHEGLTLTGKDRAFAADVAEWWAA